MVCDDEMKVYVVVKGNGLNLIRCLILKATGNLSVEGDEVS